jgi:integrase
MPAAKLAGVEWLGFHTLRHTCASLLFEQGRNIAQVSKWLGHADPAFTLSTYVPLMDEGVGGALSVDTAGPVDTHADWAPNQNSSASG